MRPLTKYDTNEVLQIKKDNEQLEKCPICGLLHKEAYIVCHICRENVPLLAKKLHINVNKILMSERERSLAWLKEVLFRPKEFEGYRAYPIIDKRLAEDKED